MYLQTSPEIKAVVPEIPRWGCLEMSLLRIIDYESGGNLTPQQISQLHWWGTHTESILGESQGVATVIGPNCFIRDPNALLAHAMAIQECDKRVYQIGALDVDTNTENFWGISKEFGKAIDWMILQWSTPWGFHFTLADGNGVQVYDPDPTAKVIENTTKIYYQVRL